MQFEVFFSGFDMETKKKSFELFFNYRKKIHLFGNSLYKKLPNGCETVAKRLPKQPFWLPKLPKSQVV